MNLKTRMIALIGTPVLLVFIVMAGIVYEILMDSMEQEMMEMATHHASDINGQLIGKKEMLAAVTRSWDAKLPSHEDMQTTAFQTSPSLTARTRHRIPPSMRRDAPGTRMQQALRTS